MFTSMSRTERHLWLWAWARSICWKMDVCVEEPATANHLGSNNQAHQRPIAIDPVSTSFHLGGAAAVCDWLGDTLRAASQWRQSVARHLRAVPAEQI